MLGLVGCGDQPSADRPTAVLEGSVSFDGKALPFGHLCIVSEDGKFSRKGHIDPEGRFKIPDAPVGKVKGFVSLPTTESPPRPNDKPKVSAKLPSPKSALAPDVQKKHDELNNFARTFPARYRESEKSGLTFDVQAGTNQWDIRLTK
jgi:hypothetical protein